MKTMRCKSWLFALCGAALMAVMPVYAVESTSTDAIINLPSAQAWQLFTSETGLKSLGYAQAQVQLSLDGTWQTSGGHSVLSPFAARVQSYDPEHMLSLRPVQSVSVNSSWLVLYFNAMGPDMTQLRWVRFHDATTQAAAAAEQQQVRQLFDQLIRRYAPECEVCKAERELGVPVK